MLTIDKKIPVPDSAAGQHMVKFPYRDMVVGDSVLLKDKKQVNSMRTCIRAWKIRNLNDWKFVSRQVDDGFRIWRIE